MRRKGHRSKLSLLLLFVVIFAFWWGISVLTQTGVGPSLTASVPSQVPSNLVTVNVTYQNNVYTFAGALPLSAACDEFGSGIAVNGQNPDHVTILLTLAKPFVDCAQAASGPGQPFSVSLSVQPGVKVVLDGLTINGAIMPIVVMQTN
jgi:hypothetical protein